ncbi:hypothetical protein F4553_005486 [Allocatelliglobosispora scoriae]|uniref:Uncharacterized protein n=1 Tax=Allocatelliglobosispora scoriae TaxID=643052 RepID=A0A841BZ16_9ACTN|nr:hypothetical protein [Allocatelliglobosispora scoriae]MBB5872052.1 hypothetical protein [Allocatelliglobosispora scoriae]
MIAPLFALLATGALVLIMRRAMQGERVARLKDAEIDDYGLLCPAAVTRDLVDAELVKTHLATGGIRSTLATDLDGRIRVLVFADELDRARRLVG